jgi:hypothetical protein
MKFSTYKTIDLAMIAIIGFAVEMIGVYLLGVFIPGHFEGGEFIPVHYKAYGVIASVLTLLAVTRYGLSGLWVVPFLTLGNFIGGRFLYPAVDARKEFNLIRMTLTLISNCAPALILFIYKRKKPSDIFHDFSGSAYIGFGIYLIQVLFLTICLMISVLINGDLKGNLFLGAFADPALSNLVSLLFLILFTFIFQKQGLLKNVKDEMIQKRIENENEKKYYKKIFSDLENEEESLRKDCDQDGNNKPSTSGKEH